jgi:tetratricopeptide (TPR) repeat protein
MHDAENRAAVWALRQALRTSGLTPFAGAGISAPFGFPLWRPFIERCAEHGGVDVTERLRRRQFEQAAEEIVAARGRAWLDRIITRRFGRTPGARRDTAAQLLPRLASGPVLTTNFDTVLETVFRAESVPFDHTVWSGKPELAARALRGREHVLFKIHGDARTAQGRVLTRAEYETRYASGSPLTATLLDLFAVKPVLFVGCSVERDRYLRFLGRAAAPPGGWHFAILQWRADPLWIARRTAYLARFRIRPIWYDEHSEIVPFLHELAPRPRRLRIANRKARDVAELESKLAACATDEERLTTFLRSENQKLFWHGGLEHDYLRLAPAMLRVARKLDRPCDELLLTARMASIRLYDDRFLGRMLERCAVLAKRCPRGWQREDYLYNLAIYNERRDPAKSRAIYRRLARAKRTDVDPALLRRLALIEQDGGAPTVRVEKLLRRSIAAAAAVRDPKQQILGYKSLGALFDARREPRHALEAWHEADRLARKLGDAGEIGGALTDLGVAAISAGRLTEALARFRRALRYAQAGGSPGLVFTIRLNTAWVKYVQAMAIFEPRGMTAAARRKFVEGDEELDDLIVQTSDPRDRAVAMTQKALGVFRLAGLGPAMKLLVAAAPVLRRHRDPWLWTNYNNRGYILVEAGEYAHARRALRTALRIAEESGNEADQRATVKLIESARRPPLP